MLKKWNKMFCYEVLFSSFSGVVWDFMQRLKNKDNHVGDRKIIQALRWMPYIQPASVPPLKRWSSEYNKVQAQRPQTSIRMAWVTNPQEGRISIISSGPCIEVLSNPWLTENSWKGPPEHCLWGSKNLINNHIINILIIRCRAFVPLKEAEYSTVFHCGFFCYIKIRRKFSFNCSVD